MITGASADTDEATRLRNAMVDAWGAGELSRPVEQAMRTVPRHLFLPESALDAAYPVLANHDREGAALRAASGPGGVADMLDQLDVRPGHRVLEIGAGTGYSAALLAHLAGRDGHVTTIDIHPEVAGSASKHLARAGCENVQVISGDGARGYARNAPYDRIIVTAGVFDIPPAWTAQAAPGARMVLPLRVSGYCLRVALEQGRHPVWRSPACELDGCIPIRGAGHHPELNVRLTRTGRADLRIDGHLPVDPGALQKAARLPPVELPTPKRVTSRNRTSLAIWLLALGGSGWLIVRQPGHGLAGLDETGVRLAVLDVASGDTFAYLADRDGELAVCAYGPHAKQLAERVADRIGTWDERLTASAEVYPAGADVPASDDVVFRTARENIQVILRNCPLK